MPDGRRSIYIVAFTIYRDDKTGGGRPPADFADQLNQGLLEFILVVLG